MSATPGGMIEEATRVARFMPYELWRDTPEPSGHRRLFVLPDVRGPLPDDVRPVVVCVPPSYASGIRRYPVIYAQDGQNLFDPGTGFMGQTWNGLETTERLAGEGVEAIVVGLWNTRRRLNEYTPFSLWWPGHGDAYVDFIIETVKPLIDAQFRTLPGRMHTGMLGSSLGGLISAWAFFARPEAFGFAAALSPAFWPGGGEMMRIAAAAPFNPGKLYLDNGTREYSARPMADVLRAKGYVDGQTLKHVEELDGRHHEPAWARRLPDALRFVLS